ncbi:hypothetical protein [Paraburkholderia sp. MM5384-R2]|uniref:hypothetical protein n=1 Tax=Paraburkholderia sp. MM5384-R2 TaxID=2723097 RepID=UPI00160C4A26|nr:hypothetical protein [Paraburkholderia sp. MM5384-R2]MBB5496739.1 hypothetical protein [Paraburkholderia sp. MM5384-R2]
MPITGLLWGAAIDPSFLRRSDEFPRFVVPHAHNQSLGAQHLADIEVNVTLSKTHWLGGKYRRYRVSWTVTLPGNPEQELLSFPEQFDFLTEHEAFKYGENRTHTFVDSMLSTPSKAQVPRRGRSARNAPGGLMVRAGARHFGAVWRVAAFPMIPSSFVRQAEATGNTESSGKSSDNRNTISLSGLFALPVNCVASAMLQIFWLRLRRSIQPAGFEPLDRATG